jgi:hypothetical protein
VDIATAIESLVVQLRPRSEARGDAESLPAADPRDAADEPVERVPVSLDALATTATLIIPPPAPPTPPPTPVAPPVARRLGALRELLGAVDDAGTMPLAGPREDTDTRWAAVLLGWLVPEGLEALRRTDAGTRLLAAAPESAQETAVLVGSMLENPPLSSITTALMLGEWLDLRDLGPAVATTCGMPTGQATRLVPSLLAWRLALACSLTPGKAALQPLAWLPAGLRWDLSRGQGT